MNSARSCCSRLCADDKFSVDDNFNAFGDNERFIKFRSSRKRSGCLVVGASFFARADMTDGVVLVKRQKQRYARFDGFEFYVVVKHACNFLRCKRRVVQNENRLSACRDVKCVFDCVIVVADFHAFDLYVNDVVGQSEVIRRKRRGCFVRACRRKHILVKRQGVRLRYHDVIVLHGHADFVRRAVIKELEKILRERYRRLLKNERYLRFKIFVVVVIHIVLRRVLRLCANGGFARISPDKSFCERVISKRFVGIVRAGKRKRGSRRVSCLIDDDCFFVIRQDIVVVRHGYRISACVFEIASLAVFCEYKVCGFAIVRCRGQGLSVGTINTIFRICPSDSGGLFVYREFAGDRSHVIVIACGKSRNGNNVFADILACAAVNRFARKRFALYNPRDGARKRGRFAVSYRDVVNLYGDRFLVYRKRNVSDMLREGVVVNNLKVYLVRACVCIFGRRSKRAIAFGRAVSYRVVRTFFGSDRNAVRLPVVRQRYVREIYC